jgi:hypothetical protein
MDRMRHFIDEYGVYLYWGAVVLILVMTVLISGVVEQRKLDTDPEYRKHKERASICEGKGDRYEYSEASSECYYLSDQEYYGKLKDQAEADVDNPSYSPLPGY